MNYIELGVQALLQSKLEIYTNSVLHYNCITFCMHRFSVMWYSESEWVHYVRKHLTWKNFAILFK